MCLVFWVIATCIGIIDIFLPVCFLEGGGFEEKNQSFLITTASVLLWLAAVPSWLSACKKLNSQALAIACEALVLFSYSIFFCFHVQSSKQSFILLIITISNLFFLSIYILKLNVILLFRKVFWVDCETESFEFYFCILQETFL